MLSDAGKRAVYDQYGEEGLRGSAATQPPGAADDIFAEFFGSTPFTYCNATAAGRQPPPPPPAWDGGGFGRTYYRGDQQSVPGGGTAAASTSTMAPPVVECRLACTLEELYVGVTKKMRISRNAVDASG